MSNNSNTSAVLEDVLEERKRQDARWGEQNHPDTPAHALGARPFQMLGIPTADEARERCDWRARVLSLSWSDIALEEFCEAVEALSQGRVKEGREELIQAAAVLVAWVESIDRREKGAKG